MMNLSYVGDHLGEVWRTHEDYPGYEVSTHKRVARLTAQGDRGRVLKTDRRGCVKMRRLGHNRKENVSVEGLHARVFNLVRPGPGLDLDLADRPGETWKKIPKASRYSMSSHGRVRSDAIVRDVRPRPARMMKQMNGTVCPQWDDEKRGRRLNVRKVLAELFPQAAVDDDVCDSCGAVHPIWMDGRRMVDCDAAAEQRTTRQARALADEVEQPVPPVADDATPSMRPGVAISGETGVLWDAGASELGLAMATMLADHRDALEAAGADLSSLRMTCSALWASDDEGCPF